MKDAPNGVEQTTFPSARSIWIEWNPDSSAPSDVPKQTFEWWWNGALTGTWPFDAQHGYQGAWFYYGASGTINVRVKINGELKVLSKYIHIGDPAIDLKAQPSVLPKGDSVLFNATVRPDSTTINAIKWWWRKKGSTDSTQVCTTRLLACTYAPDTSGSMRVHATLAGKPATASAEVTVTRSAALEFKCDEQSLPRLSPVTCVLKSLGGRPFTIVYSSVSTGLDSERGLPPTEWVGLSDRTQYTISGRRALTTTIDVSVMFDPEPAEGMLGPSRSASANFVATARLTYPAPSIPLSVREHTGLPDRPAPGEPFALGATPKLAFDSAFTPSIDPITTGPNAGYAVLTASPSFKQQELILSPALFGQGPWGQDQNGAGLTPLGPSGLRWCAATDLPQIREYIRSHELEHSTWNRIAASSSTSDWEDAVFRTSMSTQEVIAFLGVRLLILRARVDQGFHTGFDNSSYKMSPLKLDADVGCNIDDDLRQP